MTTLSELGLLANLDEVYDNLYGISRDSIDNLISNRIWPIKEVHPSRFGHLKTTYPDLIAVIILPTEERMPAPGRGERAAIDNDYFMNLDISQFDIALRSFAKETVTQIADSLYKHLFSLVRFDHEFPRPPAIDALNKAGYSMIASEFTDNLRPTTANFHELSRNFFRRILSSPRTLGQRYLELGPGQGWLRREVNLEEIEYYAIELSEVMADRFEEAEGASDIKVQRGSARELKFPSNYFDVVIASLGDPFCYPTALCEVERVLKLGGRFILTAPAEDWVKVIRPENERQKTSFRLSKGGFAQVYSFTFEMETLEKLLAACGLKVQEKEVALLRYLPKTCLISPVLIEASRRLGRDDITILNMVCASKEHAL
jgi:SAM-dependent methyltransferase